MPARQSFYAESLAESSTTSANWTSKLSLTFTPDDDAVYWLLASAAFTNSSGSNDHVGWVSVYHVQTATVLLEQSMQRQEATSPQDWVGFFGIARLSFGSAPGEQQLDVNINSSHAGDTTKIRDTRLLVIKADATDANAESLAQVNTGSTSWQYRGDTDGQPRLGRRLSGDCVCDACQQLQSRRHALPAQRRRRIADLR